MTTEQIVLDELRKNIRDMDAEAQIQVECIARTFRNIVNGHTNGALALALVGAELAAS